MKINKIAGICKRAGMIRLYDEHTGDIQWCGTDAAIYPLYSLPVLDGNNVGPVMNFSDKELKNIVVEHVRIPLRYDVNDTAEGEKYIGEPIFRFVIGSNVYNAYQRPGTLGVLFINAAYLKPLLGGEDDPELYLRSENSFTGEYIAVKQGLMLAAIIEPELDILSASLVKNILAFANAVHSEIDRMDGIPDTDPETGEIV
jgi:hypothetical protein